MNYTVQPKKNSDPDDYFFYIMASLIHSEISHFLNEKQPSNRAYIR